jgi:hypothetical protein
LKYRFIVCKIKTLPTRLQIAKKSSASFLIGEVRLNLWKKSNVPKQKYKKSVSSCIQTFRPTCVSFFISEAVLIYGRKLMLQNKQTKKSCSEILGCSE